MPLIFLLRALFSTLSLTILATGIGFTWWWYRENAYFTVDGELMVLTWGWPLWVGLALVLLSFAGKWLWVPVLARPASGTGLLKHPPGQLFQAPSGAELFVSRCRADGGRPLIFSHGASLDSSVWGYARAEFAAKGVTTYDQAGLGRSKKRGPITMARMAEDLQFVIDQQPTAPVILGHSLGGMVIQTLAKQRPDLFDGHRIAGVVLLNTSYTNPLNTMILPRLFSALQPLIELMCKVQIWLLPLTWLSAWQSYLSGTAHIANRITFGRNVTREELEHVTLISTRNSPAVIAEEILAMLHWDATDALQFCQTPVLVIGGLSDPVTTPGASEYIAASSPASKLVLLEGANHMSFLDMRSDYHALIKTHLG